MRDLLLQVAERAGHYLEALEHRPVFPDAQAVARIDTLDQPLPNEGVSPELVLKELEEVLSPATVACAGPRYFGFVTGGSLPSALAANWLATAWDQNAFSRVSSPVGAGIEPIASRWTLDALNLPSDAAVAFVTGATMANFTALAAARGAQLAKLGWDVEADGLMGAPKLDVVVGSEAHAVIYKALGFLGLGRANVRTVDVDDQGRIRPDAIGTLSEASVVCLQAGNVNSGAFDPMREICEGARQAGAWVHIDGAFGLWARAAPTLAHLADGAELAHSWATDGHKWLNVPYDSGLAIVSDVQALRRAVAVTAAYLPDADSLQPLDVTPESSRRARGIDVWAALRSLGREGLANLIERNCRQARRFAEVLKRSGIDILNDVCLNQVVAYVGDSDRTAAMLQAIEADGTFWCGPTTWRGASAIRVSVSAGLRPMMISKCPHKPLRDCTLTFRPKPFFYA